jgi:hypothetical protein
MTMKRNTPFINLSSTGWLNLAAAGLLVFYLIQISLDLFWHDMCGHLAIDYCAFWSAGRIANTNGFSAIYNLDLLRQIQLNIFPRLTATTPVPLLPIFIIPFQLLALLNVQTSYWIWTLLNLVVYFLYLTFISIHWTNRPISRRLFLLISLSLPVFVNLFTGQINVFLMVCIGEFIRMSLTGKSFKAGIWLSGLLLKPQSLILIIPFLILQRSYKTLAGWAASSTILLGISFTLIGFNGLQKLAGLWLGYVGGLPTNDVEIMMNWRMVGLHLSSVSSPELGWIAIGLGLTATLIAVTTIWDRPIDEASSTFVFAVLGILAATNIFAWHSHVHMAMILIPPIIYLIGINHFPDKIFNYWVFLPAGVYAGVFALAAFITVNLLPASLNEFINFLRGVSEFGLNIYLLGWVVLFFRKQNKQILNAESI